MRPLLSTPERAAFFFSVVFKKEWGKDKGLDKVLITDKTRFLFLVSTTYSAA